MIPKFALQMSTMSLIFKNYSLVQVIFVMIRFHKTKSFLRKTKNIKRNGVNEQNTQTKHRQEHNFRKG